MVLRFPFFSVGLGKTTSPSTALPSGCFNILLVFYALEALPFIAHVTENPQQNEQENRRYCDRYVNVEHLDFVGQHIRTGCRFTSPHIDNICIIVNFRKIWKCYRGSAGGSCWWIGVRKRKSRTGWRAREHYLAFIAEKSVTRLDVHGNQTMSSIERSESLYSIT